MKLLEYEGKALFADAGITVPAGRTIVVGDGVPQPSVSAADRDAALSAVEAAAGELLASDATADAAAAGAPRVVVKAQLDMGGRGKAGLIKVGSSPGEARTAAESILDSTYAVGAILVEGAVDIRRELYLSISVDPLHARYLVLASAEGGVEIEELAKTRPEAILRLTVDPLRGLAPWQSRGLAYDLGLEGSIVRDFASIISRLYTLFREKDAELVEINPLFVAGASGPTSAGSGAARSYAGEAAEHLVAGDAKIIIDDNSVGRQPQFTLQRRRYDSDAAFDAAVEGIPYVQFDGDISLMCAGAGLTTTAFDLVNMAGGSVANYLEFGGPNYRKAQRAMELCLLNKSSVILIVTFGTIARADVMAEGVVEAVAALRPDRPIVACIRGTNEEAAHATLRGAGIEPLTDTEEAVARAVALAAEAVR